MDWAGGPHLVGRRPATGLLNSEQFGCSEENESYSGGNPELIHNVGGMDLAGSQQF